MSPETFLIFLFLFSALPLTSRRRLPFLIFCSSGLPSHPPPPSDLLIFRSFL